MDAPQVYLAWMTKPKVMKAEVRTSPRTFEISGKGINMAARIVVRVSENPKARYPTIRYVCGRFFRNCA